MIENYQEQIDKIHRFRILFFQSSSINSNKDEEILLLIEFENGAQPPKEQHIYEYKEGYIRFIQNRDYFSQSHITYIPKSKKNHVCTEYDIMMDKYGEAGKIRYGINGAYNVALTKIKPNREIFREYIRDYLSQSKIEALLFQSSQASTRPSLNESTFIGLKLPTISEDELKHYQEYMTIFLERELKLVKIIQSLLKLKGHLLNKYFR